MPLTDLSTRVATRGAHAPSSAAAPEPGAPPDGGPPARRITPEAALRILRPLSIVGLLGYGGYRYAASRRLDASLLIVLAIVAYLAIQMVRTRRAGGARSDPATVADDGVREGDALLRRLLPSAVANALLPFLLYRTLIAHHFSAFTALSLTAIFPLAWLLVTAIRVRHVDVISAFSLAFILLGVATSLITRSTRVYLAKESFQTGLFGLACLVSLRRSRPLLFYVGRQFARAGYPAGAIHSEQRWQDPAFRSRSRRLTAGWGVILLGDALLRVALVFLLPTATGGGRVAAARLRGDRGRCAVDRPLGASGAGGDVSEPMHHPRFRPPKALRRPDPRR